MANSQADGEESRVRRRRKSHGELNDEKKKSRGEVVVALVPDISEVGRIRIERLDAAATPRRTAADPKMTSESHATHSGVKSTSGHRRRKDQHRSPEESRHRRRRKLIANTDATHVYGTPTDKSQASPVTISNTRKLGRDGERSESEADEVSESESIEVKPRKTRVRVVYVTAEKLKERRRKAGNEPRKDESTRRSSARHSRRDSTVEAPPSRSASTRELPAQPTPGLKRSNTTSSHTSTLKSSYAPSLTGTNNSKRSSFLGSFFGATPQQHREPEKLVECLTCLSDDVPRSKTAKLKCGHRMCHSCLRRIFKLSVTDPQHMPPKCCTVDHIPLKHVERLFDNNFKKTWNRKFQEFSTKNRIYCPARRCGEWIKPGNIQKEDGKKVGKCSRCKTKVCCLCNCKWHGTKDCPKDEETNRLLETAKQAGWQRCYSCRTMVELKEGCNHMTCRCTAEFCMICGLKWKSCNCPWFNYDAVEADRLNHMQIPGENHEEQEQRPHRLRRPRPNNPINYNDEINQRRRQERADEELARRLQRVAMEDEDDDDYQGGIGDIQGIGNGAGHFMNQDYIRAAHNILTGNYDQANAAANYVMNVAQARGGPPPPPPQRRMADRYPRPPAPPLPIMRRHTLREQIHNSTARRSERVIPRRTKTDYEAEAAVHTPVGRTPHRSASTRQAPRDSILAGLGGSWRATNRVNAWRTHVELGDEPEGEGEGEPAEAGSSG